MVFSWWVLWGGGGAEVAGKSSRGCLWSLQRVYAGVIAGDMIKK